MARVHAVLAAAALAALAAGCAPAPAAPAPPEDRFTAASRIYCERLDGVRTVDEFTAVQIQTRTEYPDIFESLGTACPEKVRANFERVMTDPALLEAKREAERKLDEAVRGEYGGPYPSVPPTAPPGSGWAPGSPEYQTCVADPGNPICGG